MNYTKKIWLDLRFLSQDDYYSSFIYELADFLIKETPEYFYNIYINSHFSNIKFSENSKIFITNKNSLDIKWQLLFWKTLKKQKNDLIIFFNYNLPFNYKNKYILFISELTNLHFPKKINIFKKYIDNFIFNKSIKNATKIVCFDEKTSEEINDKLNISEEKINIIPAFFSEQEIDIKKEDIIIDIKTKYNILWEFIIYNSWVWIEKNLERILNVFKKIKENNISINLLILNNKTVKDIDFRKQVIENNLTSKVFFIWSTNKFEKDYFYKNCLWVIFPFSYNTFPHSANDAINYSTNILASNLKNIKNIFWNKIIYFNETNIEDIYKKIIELKHKKNNYSNIIEENNKSKTITNLKKIIENI